MTKKSIPYDPIIVYDPDLQRWNVPSKTHKGHNYAVRVDPCEQSLTCTCVWARGMMKRTGKACIHIEKVEEWLNKMSKDQRVKYLL